MGKRRYITFKVEEDFPGVAYLHSHRPAGEPLSVQCSRCLRFAGFCCVCTCSVFEALAPPILTIIESVTLLLLLLLLLLPQHQSGQGIFSFTGGLDDLVVFSSVRAVAICVTYAIGSRRYNLSMYLYTSCVGGCAGLLYVLIKGRMFHFDPVAWAPAAAMMITFAVFSWLGCGAGRRAVVWARRRGQLGLAPTTAQRPARYQDEEGALPGPSGTGADWLRSSEMDLPAALLADADSQFVDVDGLLVHYKEAWPGSRADPQKEDTWQPVGGVEGSMQLNPLLQQLQDQKQWPEQEETATRATWNTAARPNEASGSAAAATGAEMPAPTAAWLPPTRLAAEAGATAAAQGSPAELQPAPVAAPAPTTVAAASGLEAAFGPGVEAACDCAVVLVHGFGGGVFAWRHLLQPLAAAVGARVVAFDRPGFGLTARPASVPATRQAATNAEQQATTNGFTGGSSSSSTNLHQPLLKGQQQDVYSLESQASLTLHFCAALNVKRVVLVGHADGCLVVVHAAALAKQRRLQSEHHHHTGQQPPAAGSSAEFMQPLMQQTTPSQLERPSASQRLEAESKPLLPSGFGGSASSGQAGLVPPPAMEHSKAQQQSQQAWLKLAESDTNSVSSGYQAEPGSMTLSRPATAPETAVANQEVRQQHQQLADGATDRLSSRDSGSAACTDGQLLTSQQLGTRTSTEGAESTDNLSTASSISFQCMLVAGVGSSSSGSLQQQQQQHSQQQHDSQSSVTLTPPPRQHPMSSCRWQVNRASPAQQAAWLAAASRGNVSTSSSRVSCVDDNVSAAVHVEGMVLLHPSLSGHQVSAFTRLLVGSSLGRSMMRPLLRSEVGEAISRRAWWHNPDLITAELLALYKQPLRVQGWDTALVAASRATGSVSHKKVAAQLAVLRQLPTLLVTGRYDKIVTVDKLAALSALLRRSRRVVLPSCGHLSHEETPAQLLEVLVPFCRHRLEQH